ncbi:ArsC family reductase [Sphingomonas sp. LB-2]|uniref:ArsC family reductase n=1 Tax=Sphingomonas caeni TaxID=2984949 RepID=UPI00223175BD|nr:ArsC family reductase [Sphingomonas caeni]MCW3845767.1 ArsC family reductase [Sphingomonas caeni]
MTLAMYGIKNCDTIKKARDWMAANHIAYDFHDYKAEGADRARLLKWIEAVGWEVLLNRAGTTFRKLPDADREGIDQAKAVALMLEHTSVIKRPVLEYPGGVLVGFKPDLWARALL